MLRIFLDEVERCLCAHSAGCSDTARSGAVAFIHRFGSSLNEHVHFHCCVIDGVFEPAEATVAETDDSANVMFHAAAGLDEDAIAAVQTQVRRRVLRTFVRRGLIEPCDAEEMAGWEHGGGFSVDAAVRIDGNDRAGLERLLRYCARPPFALEHLQQAAGTAVPPAPTSAANDEEPRHRAAARYLWAMLLARIYEAFPLACPICHAEMRIIAFINEAATVKKILDHIGESTQPPRIAAARGPPLWGVATEADAAGNEPQWDMSAQPGPEIEFDQRIAW